MFTQLEINNFILSVLLGATKEERSIPQNISMDIKILFTKSPKACITDNLEDTICYDKLLKLVQEFCINKEFNLIENLAYAIYHFLQSQYPKQNFKLRICKAAPIQNLLGSCCFSISD